MDDDIFPDHHSERDDWSPRSILIPRIGLKVGRLGMRSRLILPGQYMVRWSRTYRRWVYRTH